MNAPAFEAGYEPAWWWFGELATHKVRSVATNDGLAIFEIVAPAGLSVPRHVHHLEDEVFIVLEGSALFTVGDDRIEASRGSVLFGPRGVAHEYTVGSQGCTMLFAFTPGRNMEAFIAATAVPARTSTLPPFDVLPPPPEVLEPILAAHGLAFA